MISFILLGISFYFNKGCPKWCLKGQCFEKSLWSDENSATECKTCNEHYFLKGTICSG